MRIGLAQIDMGFEQKQYSRTLCQEIILTGAKENVDFMVFPEMTLTGFTINTKELGEAIETSETIHFFKQQTILHHMAICFGLPIVDSKKAQNHCIILSASGEMIANYAKIHPFSFGTEKEFYTGGTTLSSCKIKDFTLSPFICYDLRFPEIFQIASKNSTLLVVIANWPVSRKEDWAILLKARAIENQAFVVGVNRAGIGGGLKYFGDSMIISPRGKILAQGKDGTSLTNFDISCEEALQCRMKFPLKSDRRPELYQQLKINQNGERSTL